MELLTICGSCCHFVGHVFLAFDLQSIEHWRGLWRIVGHVVIFFIDTTYKIYNIW